MERMKAAVRILCAVAAVLTATACHRTIPEDTSYPVRFTRTGGDWSGPSSTGGHMPTPARASSPAWSTGPSQAGTPDRTGVTTRASEVTSDSFFPSFGVFAATYPGSWSSNASSATPNFMCDAEVSVSGASGRPLIPVYWPSSSSIRFFAYAPYRSDSNGISVSGRFQTGTPSLTYTPPSDVSLQSDLVISSTGDITSVPTGGVQPLTFRHILTAIRFTLEGPGVSVRSVTFSGVSGSGHCPIDTSAFTPSAVASSFPWTPDPGSTSSYSIPAPFDSEGRFIPALTLMLVPQALPATGPEDLSRSTISVSFTDSDGTDKSATVGLPGIWPPGQVITYNLKISSQGVSFTTDIAPWSESVSISLPSAPAIDPYSPSSDITLPSDPAATDYSESIGITLPSDPTIDAYSEPDGVSLDGPRLSDYTEGASIPLTDFTER